MVVHQLEVLVINKDRFPVENAVVSAVPEAEGETARAHFDPARGTYFFKDLRPGFFTLSVSHGDYELEQKRVQVQPMPTREVVLLHHAGESWARVGGARVPYLSQPDLIGIIFSRREDAQIPDEKGLKSLLEELGLDLLADQLFDHGTGDNLSLKNLPPAIVVRKGSGPPSYEQALKTLRGLSFVASAGPIFRQSGKGLTIFTHKLVVRFHPEVNREERGEILSNAHLRLAEEMSFAPNLVLAEAAVSSGESINEKVEELLATGRVMYAEPSMAEAPDSDSAVPQVIPVVPTDFLWPECWDRKLVGVEKAWGLLRDNLSKNERFGRPSIVIAVVDNGIKSSAGGIPENADFQGKVSDGNNKTYVLFDFHNMRPNNETLKGDDRSHGIGCAAIALARAEDTGVAGAAPNTRLMGLIYPSSDEEILQMYIWAAGRPVRSAQAGFPDRLTEGGADIFTCSIGFGADRLASGAAEDAFECLTNRGRDGKGCLAFFSAGNDDKPVLLERSFAVLKRTFACAASTLGRKGEGVVEVRAPYSNHGKEIEWCAPSASSAQVAHNPPASFGVLTASLLGGGNLPSFPEFETRLVVNGTGIATQITVADATVIKQAILNKKPAILINRPGEDTSESTFVESVIDEKAGTISVLSISPAHVDGEPVFGGPNNHENNFGGTSAAAPLAAGICALVLSANPDLTWVEAREILRDSAEKIDPANPDPTGLWRARNGQPSHTTMQQPFFSQFYGYGRLDAFGAVKKALDYKFNRDLMIRKDLSDAGEVPSAPSPDSPDIWVRRSDPASDPDAIPPSSNQPGPHQNPVRGNDHWIYARIRNRGAEPGLDAWVRFYVALWDATPLRHPDDWEPKNGVGNRTADSWEPGAYYIGEVALTGVQPGGDMTVNIPWPKGLIPPASAAAANSTSLILVEVLPIDGPRTGNLINESNNLAQKVISISG